ncbi:hypothetical protein DQ238_08125 [Geodermatophilus sp. TF02-6]|uniref:hypothetical protein n=1 Tax=Geodermatophilus sp. TF02-6 TaxID=2250575 RepID=UPI000DEBC049|nr:hypothetical protein [Geodermatophilus sp. TF02-6]RBY80545.1 hypothetical protein DQ238_08125 [Geodermatophilus sp. TF02-6]
MTPRRARRTAAALAVVLATAACTGGSGDEVGPAQVDVPDDSLALLGTVDLDAAVDGDARLSDLAPSPDGDPVALLGDGGTRSWLVDVTTGDGGPTATGVREIPAVGDDAELAVLPDGGALVAGTNPTAGYRLLTVPPGGTTPTVTDLGLRPDRATTALSPDGRTFYAAVALPDAGPAQLLAVDLAAGTVRTTAPVVPDGTVAALAARPDGGLAALLETAGRTVLGEYDADLRPVGEPVDLVPEAPVSSPADLALTADGTAVATLHLGEARSSGELVAVADGAVQTVVVLDGVGDSALDLAIAADGRTAAVPRADLMFPAELITVDLATGERVAEVRLCPGAGVLGQVAPVDGGVVVTGSCIDDDGPQATAFLVG